MERSALTERPAGRAGLAIGSEPARPETPGGLLESASCGLCGGGSQRFQFHAKDRQYRTVPDAVWCAVVRCSACSHRYLSPRVREDRIGAFYPAGEYYTHRQASRKGWKQSLMRELFDRVAVRHFGHPRPPLEAAAHPEWALRVLTPLAFRLLRFRFRRLVR